VPRDDAEGAPPPNFQADLNLPGGVVLDEDSIEETLVPAARRRLAETRLQMLSTMVLMGISRIVVTGGKIRAAMRFHIDTSDRAHEQRATDLDFRTGAQGQFGMGWWSVSASLSFAYVSSTRTESDTELNTAADLSSEVEIHFKSDYFPLDRFARSSAIGRIQGNTAVPEANAPSSDTFGPIRAGDTITSQEVPSRPQRQRSLPPVDQRLPGVGTPPLRPVAPDPVVPLPAPPAGGGGAGGAAPASGGAGGQPAGGGAGAGGSGAGGAAPASGGTSGGAGTGGGRAGGAPTGGAGQRAPTQ
jgi:hypothetical protein